MITYVRHIPLVILSVLIQSLHGYKTYYYGLGLVLLYTPHLILLYFIICILAFAIYLFICIVRIESNEFVDLPQDKFIIWKLNVKQEEEEDVEKKEVSQILYNKKVAGKWAEKITHAIYKFGLIIRVKKIYNNPKPTYLVWMKGGFV